MSKGRSIRLFLVDGTPTGIITAEIMNWTGHVLSAPRTQLPELLKRHEVARTGVYFLTGPSPEASGKTIVYIGESDNVGKRLSQHNRDESKEFWDYASVITSKDQNLTKAHIRFLESKLISIAKETGRAQLLNGTAPDYGYLPEADLADMAFFAEQIRIVLPVLGLDFLREKPRIIKTGYNAEKSTEQSAENLESPVFIVKSLKHNLVAYARQIGGDFIVLAGSKARAVWEGAGTNYEPLYNQLKQDGNLAPSDQDQLIFVNDYVFNSPSAASAVVLGRSSNGRVEWKVEGSNKSYADWQNEQIDASPEVVDE